MDDVINFQIFILMKNGFQINSKHQEQGQERVLGNFII